MIGVVIVPTGVGASIGGDAGDANPVAKLIGACCDKLITHPNVVNASDINEMPGNTLYVEGSILDRFLAGDIRLKEVTRPNRILVVVNKPVTAETINAVSAARVTIGIDAEITELATPLVLKATMSDRRADGEVTGVKELANQLAGWRSKYDVVAVHSCIDVSNKVAMRYYREGGVNPWGGVEALASRMIASLLEVPVAHAPLENQDTKDDPDLYFINNEVLAPEVTPEAISSCYLHSVLKGLHRAPRLIKKKQNQPPCEDTFKETGGIGCEDVDFMIAPDGCFGPAHKACLYNDIPVIIVAENKTVCDDLADHSIETRDFILVSNYWEAAGVVMAMRAGVHPSSVRRPLSMTMVSRRDT